MRRGWKRLSASVLSGSVLVALLTAGCSGAPTPTPTPTSSPAYDQAVTHISVIGTAQVPITWRLPDGHHPAVLAAQRFLALREILNSSPSPAKQAWLIDYVATGQVATIEHRSFDNETSPGQWTGPLWMWLGQPQTQTDGKLIVPVCRDLGWYDGKKLSTPRPSQTRFAVESATLVQVRDDDGPGHWKVTNWNPRADTPSVGSVSPGWTAGCKAWAVHTPAR